MIVVWRVTERCNLACGFCSYDRRLKRSRGNAEEALILRFGETLASYQQTTKDRVLVSWLGGEPLLWEPLAELTRVFHENYGLALSTTTNGTRLESSAVREHIIKYYAELTLSIDALGTVHDELRGCPGLFASLQKNTRRLCTEMVQQGGRGPKLRANIVLMRETIAHFEEICREIATWGITEISFNQLGGNDRPEFYPENRLLFSQIETFQERLPALRRDLLSRGVQLLGGPGYLDRMRASSLGQQISISDCSPGSTFLFVDEKGRAAPCSFTAAEYGVPIEDLRSAEDLRELPFALARSRQARHAPPCEDCLSTHVFAKFTHSYGS